MYRLILAAALLASSAPAFAQAIDGEVGVLSDYRFRGISLSNRDPAVQGGIDAAFSSGFFVGTWASNIADYGGSKVEVDLYAGYGGPVALSLILSLILASTDRFVLAGLTGEAAVGAYHAGYSLANRTLDVMFIWFGSASGPALVMALERGGRSALAQAAREQAGVMLLLAIPAAFGLALTAQPLAQLMVGEALRDQAARVTPFIAIAALFIFMQNLVTFELLFFVTGPNATPISVRLFSDIVDRGVIPYAVAMAGILVYVAMAFYTLVAVTLGPKYMAGSVMSRKG